MEMGDRATYTRIYSKCCICQVLSLTFDVNVRAAVRLLLLVVIFAKNAVSFDRGEIRYS